MPAEIISLNQFRKAKQKAENEGRAASNRVRHGRPKSERLGDDKRRSQAARDHDGKRLEDGPADDGAQ